MSSHATNRSFAILPLAARSNDADPVIIENPDGRFLQVRFYIQSLSSAASVASVQLFIDNWDMSTSNWINSPSVASTNAVKLDNIAGGTGLQIAAGHMQHVLRGPITPANNAGTAPSSYSNYVQCGVNATRIRIRVDHSGDVTQPWTYSVNADFTY
jgi:hypothetical protein